MKRMLPLLAIGLGACSPTVEESVTPVASEGVTGALFVAGKFGNTLAKVDLASGEEVTRVDSCANPHELATSPDDQHVALACYGGTTVDIFRTSDLGKVKSIELGDNARPHGIVWHENGHLYSTAEGRQSVFVIRDPLGEARTFEYATGKRGSHMIAVSPDAQHAWTTDLGSKTVTRIDLVTRRAPYSATVGEEPEGIALTPDGETLWVSARGSDMAYALDPQSLERIKDVPVGDFPLRIVLRPQGDYAVTSDLADGGLSVIDTATGAKTRSIAVSSREEAEARTQVTILFSPDGERIYVAETRTNTIAEVDFASGKVLRRLPGDGGGDGIAIIE
ncbi:YncE family protein [Qipengyuania vesicularis]|uniref:YncE family protein n=1 Tax=Qipengyuania vesicularis TaxID=2867232 RepID=UPI001C880BB1|nr:beta-propeller fold lactonase family protein [Qipengyuania vesicularis]MBX7527024.1 beta-propeller fold lactonase family protein [Qipengyuania vesicularis]